MKRQSAKWEGIFQSIHPPRDEIINPKNLIKNG
jgi:hypothetical protein